MKNIRIISPSGVIDGTFLTSAIERLQDWGFHVSVGAHVRDCYGRFAGTPEARIADTVAALTEPGIDIVLCSRGGYGLQQIIDRIDMGVRERGYNGAVVVGFSDITALHMLMANYSAPSLHAPMAKALATQYDESETMMALRFALDGVRFRYEFESAFPNREGVTKGIIRGGNLAVLAGLMGTPYALHADNSTILMIEDIAEPQYKLDRMLHQLRLSGIFSRIGGLIVGRFADCEHDPQMPNTLYDSIADMVAPYHYPVLYDAPIGHIDDNLSIPLGVSAELRTTKKAGLLTCSALPLGLEPRTP